jgi:hypothetical protein
MRPGQDAATVDLLYQEVLRAGEDAAAVRALLAEHQPEEKVLASLLRRALPIRFLEQVARTPPWSERPMVLARVVLNPRSPRGLSLRLVSSLYWRDLALVSTSPTVPGTVRVRAEASLRDLLPDLRLGERIALGKIATPVVLTPLLSDPDARVLEAALLNPRLREEDLVTALRRETASRPLAEVAASSPRWKERYAVRLALALQPRTPLPLALLQLSSLLKSDLIRVSQTKGLAPLVQAAALATVERMATLRGSAR